MMLRNNFYAYCLVLCTGVACDSNLPVPTVYPAQDSLGFKQFSKQCSSCHRPPMPNTHTAKAWPAVVARMQLHKQQQALKVMNLQEQKQVLGYLKAHAKEEE